jgi:hypothetical protein
MKNSNDTIGNRSHDLPVCIAVSQPLRYRVPPEVTTYYSNKFDFWSILWNNHNIRACYNSDKIHGFHRYVSI